MSLDIFDFEELVADMLDITDEQREEYGYLEDKFYQKFELDFDSTYNFMCYLMPHTPVVVAGLSKGKYHALLNKKQEFMLMKLKVKD